jgi:autotransporter-associated beta strand protein
MKTRALVILPLILLFSVEMLRAGSATWSLNPGSDDWNTATNWTPATVPGGPGDTATFGLSNSPSAVVTTPTELYEIVFNSGASPFTISSTWDELTISGVGITNNSGIPQNFVTRYTMKFLGGATAGNMTTFYNNGETRFYYYSTADSGSFINASSGVGGGSTSFFDNSTAANATFQTEGSPVDDAHGGAVYFQNNSSAGNARFTNLGGRGFPDVFGGYGGTTYFHDNSTAATATFTNNGGTALGARGGSAEFDGNSTAGNAIFTNHRSGMKAGGGVTMFLGDSSGGTARIILLGNDIDGGLLDLSFHNAPGVTVGSIEGDGNVYLGSNRLKVGSNNLSTSFSGLIQNQYDYYMLGGSLEKIGAGTLTLSGTNIYDGGTVVSSGTLEVTRDGGLGTGNVMVMTGTTLRLQTGDTNNYIADTAVLSVVTGSTVDLSFNGTPDTVSALFVDGLVQPAGLYGSASSGAPNPLPEFTGSGTILTTTAPTPTPSVQATNLSTRLLVGTGNNVGIGGFIVTGGGPRHILLRGTGPSLSETITDALPDPSLQLRGPTGFQTLTNDNWRETQEAEIIATGRAPSNDLESAIVADLFPGAYTAILAGNVGTTGVGLLELFDVSINQNSRLANISTRANVGTADEIVIAGFILGGANDGEPIIVRGLGPSLSETGVSALPDPKLELRNEQGLLIASDDNWMDNPTQAAIIQAAGLAPSNDLESAIAATVMPGAYTVLLSGVNDGTGVGLVEVYDLGQ